MDESTTPASTPIEVCVKGQSLSKAKARWEILRGAITTRNRHCSPLHHSEATVTTGVSVRRFSSFHLFEVQVEPQDGKMKKHRDAISASDDEYCWYHYNYHSSEVNVCARVAILSDVAPTVSELIGFNNTGNVCLWPSEEIMAFFCLQNLHLFAAGCSVCELGAGMTGLAGLLLACTEVPQKVVLTDGNMKSVENLQRTVTGNGKLSTSRTVVSIAKLLWDPAALQDTGYGTKFDHVLCADCLFFDELHGPLCLLVKGLLRPGGTCHMFAPERGQSLKLFQQTAQQWFDVEVMERYSELVWEKHQQCLLELRPNSLYDPDLHYPLYLKHNVN